MLYFCFIALPSIAQSINISGVVLDETEIGLPGANVLVQGTTIGTSTEVDGSFVLNVDSGVTLEFSFTGYETQYFKLNGETNIRVILVPDSQLLDEIVVTGYGQTQNKRLVTTSISTLDQRVIQDRPIARVEQAIQGSAPAVVVIQESGSPGAPQTIRIRGISTAGNANPLVMVNNVQVPDINFINSNDIQSINILKDAASSAIYGARGGNGVILLETKNGQNGDSGPQMSLSSYYGIQALATEGEYLTGREYANYYNESSLYQIREGESPNGRPVFSADEVNLLPNTSWIREVSDNAHITDHHLGISGGTDELSYYGSMGYFDQGGIIGNSDFTRTSFALGFNADVSKKFDVNFFSTFTQTDRTFIAENNINSRIMSSVASLPPIFPARDSLGFPFNNGDQTGVSINGVRLNPQPEFGNPLYGLDYSENRGTSNVLYANVLLNFQVLPKLRLSTSLGYVDQKSDTKSFGERFSIPNSNIVNPVNSLFESTFDSQFAQWEAYATFDILNNTNAKLNLIAGTSLLENESFSTSRSAENFFNNTFDEVNFSDLIDFSTITVFPDNAQKNTTQSFYGKLDYNLSDKYLFSSTVRADGSSKFGPNNRWGIFPSVSAAWIISSEDFLKSISQIDLLKVRASWGINGNDQIAPYQYIRRFNNGLSGLIRQDFNENVKWEEISQFNLGIDLNMFSNKLGVTLDYYIKNTDDMLLAFPVPGFLGVPAPIRNAASISNSGIEAVFLYRNRINDKWSYEVNFNIGASTNEVTSLNGGDPIAAANLRSFANSPSISLTQEGHPIASFYGYTFDGVDERGNAVYRDLNNDGVIDPANDRSIIGNPFPDFIYGLNLRLNYINWDFSAFVSGSQGNDVVNSSILYSVVYGNRTRSQIENMWTHENTNSDVPRASATEVVNNEFSSFFIEDGSFLRFKNITLGYSFPENSIRRIGIGGLRIYFSGNNLFTFTSYSGLDPEIGANNDPLNVGVDQGFYPQAKSYMLGLNVNF